MSYNADVYNIFIASPGDVNEEREIVKKIIYEWNVINSGSRGIVLLPLDWKMHSVPIYGKLPQDNINEHILKNADIVVGIFWSKLGTPTKEYKSGTVEEIEKHLKANKLTMLYFSKKSLPQDLDFKEFENLKNFKESCQNKGLYRDYENIEEFTNSFRNDLSNSMNVYSKKLNNVNENENELEIPNNIGELLSDGKKYLLLFHDAINHSEQSKIDTIAKKLTEVYRKIFLYKEYNNNKARILNVDNNDIFDELIENYNIYVNLVQTIVSLRNTDKSSPKFYEIQNNINSYYHKLLELCDYALSSLNISNV